MKYTCCLFFISLTLFNYVQAQTDSIPETQYKNHIYTTFSFAGLGGALNLNYERQVFELKRATVNARVGAGFIADWGFFGKEILGNWAYILGKSKNHLELDLGILMRIDQYDPAYTQPEFGRYDYWTLLNIGYRYQKPNGRFLFRTGVGSEYIYAGLGMNF